MAGNEGLKMRKTPLSNEKLNLMIQKMAIEPPVSAKKEPVFLKGPSNISINEQCTLAY
jgi:hypothetical protein